MALVLGTSLFGGVGSNPATILLNRVRKMFYRMKTYNIKHIKKQQVLKNLSTSIENEQHSQHCVKWYT